MCFSGCCPFFWRWALPASWSRQSVFCGKSCGSRRGFISAILSFVLLALLFAVLTVLLMNLMQQTVRLFRALPQYLAELPAYFSAMQRRLEQFCASCPRRACKGGCSGHRRRVAADILLVCPILRPVCQRRRRRFVESSLRVFICSHHCTGYILYSEPIPSVMAFLRRQLPPRKSYESRRRKEKSALHPWLNGSRRSASS